MGWASFMNTGRMAVLFAVMFLLGAVPLMVMQPSGSVDAGLSAGFTKPLDNIYHLAALVAIGVLAAWFGKEAIVLLPLCALLMLVIGAMLRIDEQQFPLMRHFIAG